MNNVKSSEESVSLLNALNDFALTVLAPLPNNSYFLSQWYKFKPLLAAESYDPFKIQAFISSLDAELPFIALKKPPLSNRSLPDLPLESSKDNILLAAGGLPVNNDSMFKGDVSYEGSKRSVNSHNSNSTFTPNSLSGYNGLQDQTQPKEKPVDMSARPEVQIDQLKAEKASPKSSSDSHSLQKDGVVSLQNSVNKDVILQKPRFASDYGFSQNSPAIPSEIKIEPELSKQNSINSDERITSMVRAVSVSDKIIEPETRMNQKIGDSFQPESPGLHAYKTAKKDLDGANRSRSLTALEYIANTLNKPLSAVSNYSLYTKFSVSETNLGPSTFYYSFIISYFLHLLSDRSTSLILSSMYERIVVRKIKLSFYINSEQLYETLTTSLKTLINEKISRTVSTKALQELFLEKFYEDRNFRDGLVAVIKELLVDHIATLDIKTFSEMFGEINFERLKSIIRSQESEPTEDMISLFPYFVEGDIEIHYIQSDKIEIVLYQQKEHKSFGQPLFPLICDKYSNEGRKKIYHALLVDDQTEALEEFVSAKKSKREKHQEADHVEMPDMKGTVYMSMDSNHSDKAGEDAAHEFEFFSPVNDFKNGIKNESKQKQQKKKIKQKTAINRDFLLTKINDLVSFMTKHSDKLGSYSKKPNYLENHDRSLHSAPYEITPIAIPKKQPIVAKVQHQPASHYVPAISQRPASTLHSGAARNLSSQNYAINTSSKNYNLHVDTYLARARPSKDVRHNLTAINITNTSRNYEYTSLSPSKQSKGSVTGISTKNDRFQATKDFIKNAFPSRNDVAHKDSPADNKKNKEGLSTISAISKAGGAYLNRAYSAGLPGLTSRQISNNNKPTSNQSGKKDSSRDKENYISPTSVRSPGQKSGLNYYQREAALARTERDNSLL